MLNSLFDLRGVVPQANRRQVHFGRFEVGPEKKNWSSVASEMIMKNDEHNQRDFMRSLTFKKIK
jgi:hypothetical protein